jgi:hypothetical protein
MENNQEAQPQVNLDSLDLQKTRELLARQGVPMIQPALPDFFAGTPDATEPDDPLVAQMQAGEWTGKDIHDYFMANDGAEFTFDDQGREAFKKVLEYKRNKDIEIIGPYGGAVSQMGSEIVEGIAATPNPLTDPGKFAASSAEGAYRGLRDIYGILFESEDPSSPLFKFRSYVNMLLGKGDGDIDSAMRQFHDARKFGRATYNTNSLLAEMLPEGYKDTFNSYVDQKYAIGFSYLAWDVPEAILSAGSSTTFTAARMAARSGSKAAHAAKAASALASWTEATTARYAAFGQRVLGNALEGTGKAVQAPFKAMYGTSQAAAQLAGDYAGNAVRNMAAAEVVGMGAQALGESVRHPAMGFFRSFGVEALGEVMQVAGQDMVDRALGKTMVKADSLGMTTLERMASGTAKGAETMSREAQLLSKGINAAVGWAPSLSSATLKTMARDGSIGFALGYLNSPSEGAGAGLGMGMAWGGLSGSIRHLHAYTNYTPQDTRVVDNFRDYVIPSFGRIMGPTSMEMAKRFHDKVNTFGDLRTSSIELSHLSTLVAHEASLVGEGNVMFYFGNSEKEFSNVLAESNVKPADYDKVMGAFQNMGTSAGMFEKITLNDGSVKRLIAINSDLYRPTTARHEITHALFRSVVEANAEMDSIIDKTTGRYMGDVFNPSYASRIFGTSKDAGVMPDAAWQALMISYGAAKDWSDFGKPTDQVVVGKITEMAQHNYGNLLSRIRDHLNKGVDMQKYEVMDDFRVATMMAEEAFAYYAAGTSNVFPVDKYVKDPAARNLLRAWAENRAARKGSRILSSLEEAGVEIKAKFTNADGSPKLFDENGNPAIETYMYDDGVVIRSPGMDSWVESVLKQAYARSEVLVSTLDPYRQEAFAKEHGKTHLFKAIAGGGMRLKSPSELDEASREQANKILSSLQNVNEQVRPVIESTPDGGKRIKLENANAETLNAIQQSGAFTAQEFNELLAIVKVAEKNRVGDVTFNVLTGTLLAHTKQVRRGGGVFRLTGSDVPVTYRTFMPYSVEVTLRTHDAEGNPLRSPKGGVLIHSVDVAAVNRRLMKMFKKPDVRSLFGNNFSTFVDRFNQYVTNQSGLTGAKMPSADLFRPEFGDQAERVRDIMYESFGGRKRKDDAFINTPGDGYAGGADDPNRPFFTMRFDTLADIKVHPTSWNVHSSVQPFPYVHLQGYDGVARNFQITGFTERDLGNGAKYLKDNHGFEIYDTKNGFALYNPFAIKVGVFKTAKAAIKRAGAELGKIDEADRAEQSTPMIDDTGHHDQTLADLEMVTETATRAARFHLGGLHTAVVESAHQGKKAVEHIDEQISGSDNTDPYRNRVPGEEVAFSKRFISLYSMLGDKAKEFDRDIEINGKKYGVKLSDTQIAITDPDLGRAKGTDVVGGYGNEILRIDREWFKDLYAYDKDFLQDQLARRLSHALKVNAMHKAGLINLPTAFNASSIRDYRLLGEAMYAGASGPTGQRDAAISKSLESHGLGMATLAGDIRWAVFGETNKPRTISMSDFRPRSFTKGFDDVPKRWQSAFNSFIVTPDMVNDPEVGQYVQRAMESKSKQFYDDKVGAETPLYLDVTTLAPKGMKRDQLVARLLSIGAQRGEFWRFHSEASGIQDLLPAMREFLDGSGTKRAGEMLPEGDRRQRAIKAQAKMQEGPASEMVKRYLSSLEKLAARGGMFTKSVAGFFNEEGKLRTGEDGTKKGFVSAMAMLDLSDEDVMRVVSMQDLYGALSVIADEIKRDPTEANKLDYVRTLALIMRVTEDQSMIYHEFKSLDDRMFRPGKLEIRAKTGLLEGAEDQKTDFYTLPPTMGEVVSGRLGGDPNAPLTPAVYSPLNVNRNHPSRFEKIASERAMHFTSSGIPAMVSAHSSTKKGEIDISLVSHIVAAGDSVRSFMANMSGDALVTSDPGSLRRSGVGITPSESNWNGVMPALALQFFASKDGEKSLTAMIPSAVKAVEETFRAAMGYKWKTATERLQQMAKGSEIRSAEVTTLLKAAGIAGENMVIMEQLAHGYIETKRQQYAGEPMNGALRIAQALSIHENLFKAGLDTDSFPGQGAAHSFLRSIGVKQAKLTPASNKYLRDLKQFIKTGSVAAVDDGYSMQYRTMDATIEPSGKTSQGVPYGTAKVDTVQGSPLMMITGADAIRQLDQARKNELLRLGLIGRMTNSMGQMFDYFELSDSKAEINLQQYGGSTVELVAQNIPGGMTSLQEYVDALIFARAGDAIAIDDFNNRVSAPVLNSLKSVNLKMKDLISHPELYAFYPGIGDAQVVIRGGLQSGAMASYRPQSNVFIVGLDLLLQPMISDSIRLQDLGDYNTIKDTYASVFGQEAVNERTRTILLHEIQHAVDTAERNVPAVFGQLVEPESAGAFSGSSFGEMYASQTAGGLVNAPLLLGGSDQIPVPGPSYAASKSTSSFDQFGYNDFEAVDTQIEATIRKIHGNHQDLIRMTTGRNMRPAIDAQSPDVIQKSLDRIFEAPAAVDLMSRVIPNQILLTEKTMSLLNIAIAKAAAEGGPDAAKAVDKMLKMAERARAINVKLDGYAKLMPKYDASAVHNAIGQIEALVTRFNEEAEAIGLFVGNIAGERMDEFFLLRSEIEAGLHLSSFKSLNAYSSMLKTPEHMYKVVHTLMRDVSSLIYGASEGEFNANVTMARSRMGEAELASDKRPQYAPSYERMAAYATWLDRQMSSGYSLTRGPTLRMIGGSAGSESMNVSIFGKASGNMFAAGMRMIARSALLSHYVSNINSDLMRYGKATYNSKGWRIGADGLPVYVSEVGTLSGLPGGSVEGFTNTYGLATGVEQLTLAKAQIGAQNLRRQPNIAMEQFGNFRGTEQQFRANVQPVADLVLENDFLPATGAYNALGGPIAFMAGLTGDGKSVTIQDVAKAMGATVHVEDTIGYRSAVLNALYTADSLGIPSVIKADQLADILKGAGVPESELHAARVFDIQDKFKGSELSIGELVDIVAVLHEVPMLSSYQGGFQMKELLAKAMKEKGAGLTFKELYDLALSKEAVDGDDIYADAVRHFINHAFGDRGTSPLTSIFAKKSESTPTGSAASRFFMMDVISTAIQFSYQATPGIKKMLGKERGEEVIKRIIDKLVKKYPDENSLPVEWDPLRLSGMLVKKEVDMSMSGSSLGSDGYGGAGWQEKERKSTEAMIRFTSRLERLLVKLTPMAEKLGQMMLRAVEAGDDISKESGKHSTRLQDLLFELYSNALDEGMKDSFSSSTLSNGDKVWSHESARDFRGRSTNARYAGADDPNVTLMNRLYGAVGDAPVAGTIVMHGLMGGAQRAFADVANVRSIQSGMAGASIYPRMGRNTASPIEGFTGNAYAGMHKSIKFGAGDDVPTIIEVNSERGVVRLARGNEAELEKSDNFLAANINPTSLEALQSNQERYPVAVQSAILAQRALVLRANALLAHIDRFSGDKGVEHKLSALQGASRISASSLMSLITEKPELVAVISGPDAGPQLEKAKALLSIAESVTQGVHNVGFGNIVATDQGYYNMPHDVDRIKSPGYKPMAQATLVRSYIRGGALVVGSTYEALGATSDHVEAKVINALAKRDNTTTATITAAQPMRVMSRTLAVGANLLSETANDQKSSPLQVSHLDAQAMEKAIADTRSTRILRAMSKGAEGFMAEFMSLDGEWIETFDNSKYYLSTLHRPSNLFGSLRMNYKAGGFMRHLAHVFDGTSLLSATAQMMYKGNNNNAQLAMKLDSFVKNNWAPVEWWKDSYSVEGLTESQVKTQIRMMASIEAAMQTIGLAYARRGLSSSLEAGISKGMFDNLTNLETYLEGVDSNSTLGMQVESNVRNMLENGRISMLNGLSFDAVKQIFQLAGQIFVKQELIDRVGSPFTAAEKVAIEAMMADTASRLDLVDCYDIDPVAKMRTDPENIVLGGSKSDRNNFRAYGDQKNAMEHNLFRRMLHSVHDMFSMQRSLERMSGTLRELSKIDGIRVPLYRDSQGGRFGIKRSGTERLISGLRGNNQNGVVRTHGDGAIRLSPELLDDEFQSNDYRDKIVFDGHNYHDSRTYDGFMTLVGAKGQEEFSAHRHEGTLGVLGAMFEMDDPVDMIHADPVPDAGIMDVDVGARGHSALSQSVIRSFLADSIIGRAQRSGSKTIEIAPAGGQLSFGSAGVMEVSGDLSGSKTAEAVLNLHARGTRTISKSLYSPLHAKRKKQGFVLSDMTSELPGRNTERLDEEVGSGYLSDPYRAGEQATKKGYAWKRLPDGRIMVNITGDHLGYKLDDMATRAGRVGYGFSLAEGLGYDPNTGLLLPANLLSQMMANDAATMMSHPFAGLFDPNDPAIMQAYIDGAIRDKRGYHHTRGNIDDISAILPSSSSFSGRMEVDAFKAFLMDKEKVFTRRALHAASIQDVNAPSSHMTIILPAGLSVEDIAATLMTLHVDPSIGYAMTDSGKRERSARAATLFPDASLGSSRFDRGVYGEKVDPKTGLMPFNKKGAYNMGSLAGLEDSVKLGISQDPHLWNDVFTAAAKMAGEEGGYFLPDTERTLSVSGDTGVAIASLFPGRPDLLKHAWDSKAANGIKVWKRTGPKDDVNFRPYVVELNSPSMMHPEGGLVIGKRAIAFKTEAEAIAYSNKVAAQATSSMLVRALSGGDFRVIERPKEGGTDKFFPDTGVRSIDRVIPQSGRAFQEALAPSGLHRVGDLDMAMSIEEARKLGKALGKNAHVEFNTPPISLHQITGASMQELESIVRRKVNAGLPQGALNFSSKAMNAIIRGTHASPKYKNFTHLPATEWLAVLSRNGVTKDEIRQTGLGHMLANYGEISLSRQDLAEFVAASYPIVHRASPAFYGMHAAQQLAALGLPEQSSVGGKGHFVPPFIHDSRLQTRANQINAVQNLFDMRDKMEALSRTDEEKQASIPLIAIIDQSLTDFAKALGMSDQEAIDADQAAIIAKLQELAKNPKDNGFTSYEMRNLELTRMDLNERIRAMSQDAAMGVLFSKFGEVQPFIKGLMAPDELFPGGTGFAKQTIDLLDAAKGNQLTSKEFGYGSGYADLGQSLHDYGSFGYPSYVAGAYEQHYQTIIRFADKAGMATMKEYLKEIKAEIITAKTQIEDGHPNAEKLKERIGALEAMRETAERVMEVRLTAAQRMEKESGRHHGSHFSGSMPHGTSMTGGGGAFELGHSRFAWGMLTSALTLDGFASLMGIDPAGEFALGFRREPVALLEEIQSDVFQNIDLFGQLSGEAMFLPADAAEKAAQSRSGELAKLVADHASMRALADNAEEKAVGQLVSIIGRPADLNSISTGTKVFDSLAAKLFLDQTDLFQRSMMHEAVPAFLRNTGRKAKVPEGIRASISRMTGGAPAPKEIFVFEFDHELIDMVRMYPDLNKDMVEPEIWDRIKARITENMNNAKHADPDMAGQVNPRAVAEFRADQSRIANDELAPVINRHFNIIQSIIGRGVEALRAQGYDALSNEARSMQTMGLHGPQRALVEGLNNLGKRANDIGNTVASHVARAMVKDEKLAMQMAAYVEGSGAIDYEALVDRTIERIRKEYGDSKSYIGKAVLVILDQMKKMPSEVRPFASAAMAFGDVKGRGDPFVSQFLTAIDAIGATDSKRMIEDVAANLPNPADRSNMIYVRVDAGANGNKLGVGAGTNNTFRTFTDGLDFANYIREIKRAGASDGEIRVYAAPYHRHPGSAAGDFAKNVVEVFAAMSQGPKFLDMAKAKEAEIAAMRKEVKEVFSTNSSGYADTPKGKKVIFPDVIPGVAEGTYKSTQLIMNVLDSMNHGSHGVGILDATYQLQRGGGLKEPNMHIRFGGPRGWIVSSDQFANEPGQFTKFVGGALIAYEKSTGKHPNGPEGPHGGFLHRMATMDIDGELGSQSQRRFSHNNMEGTMFEHFKRALEEMRDYASDFFDASWIRSMELQMENMKDPFKEGMPKPHAYEGKKPVFEPGSSRSSGLVDKVAAKLGSDTGLFAVAGPSGDSAGWGYIANYGLPMYSMDLLAPGSSMEFRRNFALDAFDRPTISAEGTKLVINDKNGRAVEVIDQATATPRQLEAFRERYLQLSSYKGGNWMIKTFLKEFGPVGAYVDFGIVGPTSAFTQNAFGSFPEKVIGHDLRADVLGRIRAKYIEGGLIPTHLGEDVPTELMPSFNAVDNGNFNQDAINQAMINKGMISPEAEIDMNRPARMAQTYVPGGPSGHSGEKIPVEIAPQGAMAQPMVYGAKGRGNERGGWFHAGLGDDRHVKGLVKMYFPRAHLDPAAAAAYVMRMTNPLNSVMVHTPLKRTKEMDIQFRRRVLEGIPLMQITGADAGRGEPISTNGVKRLAHMLRQREMLPRIKDTDETP